MVLDVDGEVVLLRVRRDALGHRPGDEHAVALQAQVPVEAAGVVLLDRRSGPARRRLRLALRLTVQGSAGSRACGRIRRASSSSSARPCGLRGWQFCPATDAWKPAVYATPGGGTLMSPKGGRQLDRHFDRDTRGSRCVLALFSHRFAVHSRCGSSHSRAGGGHPHGRLRLRRSVRRTQVLIEEAGQLLAAGGRRSSAAFGFSGAVRSAALPLSSRGRRGRRDGGSG